LLHSSSVLPFFLPPNRSNTIIAFGPVFWGRTLHLTSVEIPGFAEIHLAGEQINLAILEACQLTELKYLQVRTLLVYSWASAS